MANPFLNDTDLVKRDTETALMLERAIQCNLDKMGYKGAVAFTNGTQVYLNTDDNLANILPAYNQQMLKWLLWHERMHMELKHHARYFKYLKELDDKSAKANKLGLTKEEVNIIMDILVHDWMSKKFPELVNTAVNNLAQMRNRNSLKYTFTTYTLEEMLSEYAEHKKSKDSKEEEGKGTPDDKGEESKPTPDKSKTKAKADDKSEQKEDEKKSKEKGHGAGGTGDDGKKKKDTKKVSTEDEERPKDEHDKTDWSKLEKVNDTEFIEPSEGRDIQDAVKRMKRKKFKLAKLTETLNGLVTSTRQRNYKMPSTVHVGSGVLLKGSTPGRTQLYLCFDASGSMSSEMQTFKDIISKSIPQAMDMPCDWFAGYNAEIKPDHYESGQPYYKGKFKDFIPVHADNGYSDDGDRTIKLCWQAEQLGYSPIGVTDGGGKISWSKDKLKQLKRTVLVGDNPEWLEAAKKINPRIQILDI